MTLIDTSVSELYVGDCRELLKRLPPRSVQTCITSPPYLGLRDYGVAGQIGLESSVAAYVAEIVGVFRLVRDALRDDGTLWLNLGDSYAGSRSGRKARDSYAGSRSGPQGTTGAFNEATHQRIGRTPNGTRVESTTKNADGCKPKDLIGLPWEVAFALRADGWYLRSDIIWHKLNPMPEAVVDRPTTSHEHIFLLSKSPRYYYDAAAIREPVTGNAHDRGHGVNPKAAMAAAGSKQNASFSAAVNRAAVARVQPTTQTTIAGGRLLLINGGFDNEPKPPKRRKSGNKERTVRADNGGNRQRMTNQRSGVPWEDRDSLRNKRSVWSVQSAPYDGAHFATFPPALIEPCVLAGAPVGGVVLDPFFGSGTTGAVAEKHGRKWIGFDLNPKYAELAKGRTAQRSLLGLTVAPAPAASADADAEPGSEGVA